NLLLDPLALGEVPVAKEGTPEHDQRRQGGAEEDEGPGLPLLPGVDAYAVAQQPALLAAQLGEKIIQMFGEQGVVSQSQLRDGRLGPRGVVLVYDIVEVPEKLRKQGFDLGEALALRRFVG